MAFLEGRTVKDNLRERPLPLEEALDVAVQAAQGVQAAHEKGVVHRDIKSSNLMVAPRGQVKVLDFGLAQLAEGSKLTKTATILGTPAYMSPEQALREPTDRRTDIWSLAVVLYERVTGRLPFEGEKEQAVLYAIVNEEAEPPTALRTRVPTELDRIVGKAMAKSPDERYQHVDELLVDLRALRGAVSGVSAARQTVGPKTGTALPWGARAGGRRGLYGGLAATAVLLLGAAYWSAYSGSDGEPAPVTLQSVPVTSYPGIERTPAISPNGDQVAYSWNGPNQDNFDIYVQLVGAGRPLRLTSDPAEESHPAWSPDGRYIAFLRAFLRGSAGGAEVIRIPALGGAERKLGEVSAFGLASGLSWSPDGKFLAVVDREAGDQAASSIFSLSVETGEKRRLTTTPVAARRDFRPIFSPDGRRLAFVRRLPEGDVYLLNLVGDGGPDGEPHRLTFGRLKIGGLDWRVDGRSIVFSSRSGGGSYSLWQVSVSGGEPKRLAVAADNATFPSISRQGNRLVYEQSQFDANIWRAPGLGFEAEASTGDQRKATRFIASTRHDDSPHYSPDGSKIVFLSYRSGTRQIWVTDADGMNPVQVTSFEETKPGSPRWSAKGRWIAFDLAKKDGTVQINVVSAAGGAPRQLTDGPYRQIRPAWSRDGSWVYFGSERGGDWQVWKVPFEGGEPVQVTRGGGREAMESSDGAFVYYTKRSPSRGIWRVPVNGGEEERVFDQGMQARWEITEKGIYLLNMEARPAPVIEFFRFAAESVETVAELAEDTDSRGLQFTVSPDGRWVLYGRYDNVQSDIMLVEGFE